MNDPRCTRRETSNRPHRPHDERNDSDSNGLTLAELFALPTTVDVTTAARALGLGRSTAYELARRDELPCRVLHVGSSYRIPTADLLRVLGIEPPRWEHNPPFPPAA
jgi:excisionase family DNA binding protein